ncbi:MAG: glycosyltransferase family 4 protein [Oligoflexales bacterium]
MRIGINGRFLVAKQTGVQRAAYNLIRTLVDLDEDNEYFIFTGHDQLNRPEWQKSNTTVVPSGIRGGETSRNLWWEQWTLPALAKKYNVDLLHCPANMAPLFYKGKAVVHIHDLCFIVNPKWYSFSFRHWYNFVIPRLAKNAARVVTNSNNSRNDLLLHCGLSAEKVSTVYWAVDESFLQQPPKPRAGQPESYILYVGSLEPRKNIKTLVESYESMRDSHPELKPKLVLIGGESPLFADVSLTIKKYKEDVIFKGFADEQTLRSYYRYASLVAYPSLYEGFGLPPLEAMASGTPVVTSMSSSIPEVVGNAALMVGPYDVEGLSDAMAALLTNVELREELVHRGYLQVQKFQWEKVAKKLLAIYHEVGCAGKKQNSEVISRSAWEKVQSKLYLANP